VSRTFWTRKDDRLLRSIYPWLPTLEVAKALGRTVVAIYGRVNLLGIEKSAAYLAEKKGREAECLKRTGVAFRFPKGHVPANKGQRRPGYAPGRMASTQFKKGQQNYNVMPIGSTRLVDGYVYVKVAAVRYVPYTVNWKLLHVIEWERINGELPEGHALAFKDGNRLNTGVDNLELISRAELMRRNTVHNLPPELKEVIQLAGAVKRMITMRTRNAEEQNQRPA
jgi:hypothetical protein